MKNQYKERKSLFKWSYFPKKFIILVVFMGS